MNERERQERAMRALEREGRELEHAAHAAFMHLPPEMAPPTLLPRVLAAAARMHQRPWYARGWYTWPQSWQRASLAACLVILAIAVAPVPSTVSDWWGPLTVSSGSPLTSVVTLAEAAGRAARLADSLSATAASIWRTFFAPLVLYATAISLLLCAALGLFAAALDRLVPGKASY